MSQDTEQTPPETILDRTQMLVDLLNFCNRFVEQSAEWRRASYETQWARWQRNADAVYDPDIAAKKESWQSKAFVPITPSHRESAAAQLYKTEVGPRPPLEVKARKGIVLDPQLDQAEIIRDLILREREKSRYEVERNPVIEDKTTYGSGFARMYFETKIEDRVKKVPDLEPINVFDPTSVMRAVSGQRQIIGYHDEIEPTVIYRGVRFDHISIWDVFPDPKAIKIKGSSIAHRYFTTLGEVLEGIQEGYYLPEADKLRDIASQEETPDDQKVVETDRGITDARVERTFQGKRLECFELFARLPKKWVLIDGQEIDDPDKLIPAIVRFHKDSVVSVIPNDSYDGEPHIYKDDYMPVAGQFYGRGIPEMLKDIQLIVNETVNQRLDTGSIALSQKFAVIEKAVVDPKDFEENRNVIKLKAPTGMNLTDIKQVFGRVDMGQVDKAAFVESQEFERWAQERTKVNRQTLSTAGQVKDANQTLGGMELVQAAAGELFAYIGMLSEFNFQYEITRAYWKEIYKNYNQEDYIMAIGPERAQFLIPMSPEEVENSYQYIPMGVYTMENKAMRQARLAQWDAQFGMMPWANRLAVAEAMLQATDEDPQRFIIPEAQAVQIVQKAGEMAQGMAMQQSGSAKQGPGAENTQVAAAP